MPSKTQTNIKLTPPGFFLVSLRWKVNLSTAFFPPIMHIQETTWLRYVEGNIFLLLPSKGVWTLCNINIT